MKDLWKEICENKYQTRFHQAGSYSPYSEMVADGIQKKDGLTYIQMNSFYRYDVIMQPLFRNKNINEQQREWLFDCYMHYLTLLEYRTGTTEQEYRRRSIWNALDHGEYGEDVKRIFVNLSSEQKYIIADAMWKQKKLDASVWLFSETMSDVLQDGILYKNELQEKELYLYLNVEKQQKIVETIRLMEQLFLPIGYTLRIFWKRHFAMVGEQQTMKIDEIELI